MKELLQQFVVIIQNFVDSNNIFISVFFGVFAIVLESIIPALPLAVFIAINTIAFGNIMGFIISWLSTVLGCSISFYICRKLSKLVRKKYNKNFKIMHFISMVDEIKFSNLCLILAMPFTPAFSVNIAAGLSKMKYQKYLIALLISKSFIVYFWGYIGSNILINITDIALLIKMVIIILIIFIISKIVTKKFNL